MLDFKDDESIKKIFDRSSLPEDPDTKYQEKLKEMFLQKTRLRRAARRSMIRRLSALAASVLFVYFALNFAFQKNIKESIPVPSKPSWLYAAEVEPLEYSLTIFNENLAVVRDQRKVVRLPQGRATVEFSGVASQIIPESLRWESLSHPRKVKIVEQNYLYDLAGRHSLLKRYVDREVMFLNGQQWFTGILLSHQGGLTLKTSDGVRVTSDGIPIRLPKLPEGLLTRPTLRWKLLNEVPGDHNAQVSYLTRGLSWQADHNFSIDEDSHTFDLESWITVNNRSGASFAQAKFKFLAGDINQIQEIKYGDIEVLALIVENEVKNKGNLVTQKAFSEYHLYTLQHVADLPDRSIKQLNFLSKQKISYRDRYRLTLPWQGNLTGHVQHLVKFENTQENNLGMPLPKGRARLFFGQSQDRELIAQREIDHTPREESLSLLLGHTLRVSSQVMMTDLRGGNSFEVKTFRVDLANLYAKKIPFELVIPLDLRAQSSVNVKGFDVKQERQDANTELVSFELEPNQKVTLEITITSRRP